MPTTLVMTTAGTVLAGGVSGVETYTLANGGANSLSLVNGNFTGVTGSVIRVNGGSAGNTVNASGAANRVIMVGGAGKDSFTGGTGSDIFMFAVATLAATDTVVGGGGNDYLEMTTAGTVLAGGVSGVEVYELANGAANSLTLTNANFTGVTGSSITVYGGTAGNTVNASGLSAPNRVVMVGGAGKDVFTGGAGNDIFEFTAAALAASDTVAGGAGADHAGDDHRRHGSGGRSQRGRDLYAGQWRGQQPEPRQRQLHRRRPAASSGSMAAVPATPSMPRARRTG